MADYIERQACTETDLMNLIRCELSKRGCFVQRTNSATLYTKDGRPVRIGIPGQSDLCGHRPGDGRSFYIEVKRPGEEPRENQERFLRQMRDSGALAGVAHSVEEAVEIVFGDMDEEKRENMARVCPKCGKRLVFKSSVGDKYSCANCLSVFSF